MRRSAGPLALPSLAALLALLVSSRAEAYRPFDGTDAAVLEPGQLQIELGPLHYAREGSSELLFTPVSLSLAAAAGLEVVADFTPTYPQAGPVQLTDTDVLVKYLLRSGSLQGEGGPSIAMEAGALLPEVNGQPGFGTSLTLVASERWSGLTLHLNNSGELSRSDLAFAYTGSLLGELELGSRVRPVTELGLELEPGSGTSGWSVLAGVIWTVSDALALDAAGRVGRADGVNTFEARLGLTWVVGIWEPARSSSGGPPRLVF